MVLCVLGVALRVMIALAVSTPILSGASTLATAAAAAAGSFQQS